MPPRRLAVVLAVIVALVAGCSGPKPSGHRPTPDEVAAGLSDEDLVGQVLVPYAYGNDANTVSAGSAAGNRKLAGVDTPAQMVAKYRLGGVILVGFSADDPTGATNPTTNLDSPAQVHQLTAGLQTAARQLAAGVPLLVGTDQEYGVVTRIRSGVTQLPSAMALGAAGDPALTQQAWAAAGADLAALGLNVDFAPDADVLGPGGNTVIGSRSYGASPDAVADQVGAAVRGLHTSGVAATLKHFPGHGHTTADSHTGLPVLSQSSSELAAGDLPPFVTGIRNGADLVMSGHLDVRATDPGVPATFSTAALTGLLRGKLGFGGVVITDALNMAPAEKWSPGEAAVRAILAGNDMLLEPPDLAAASRGLLDALHSGRVPRTRLAASVTRILELKARLAAGPAPGSSSSVDSAERQAVAARAAAAAVTVLAGACAGPLVSGPVTVTTSRGRDQQRAWLTSALRAEGVPVVDRGGTRVHLVGYGDTARDLVAGAAVTVAMDTPYILSGATSPVRLATYSSTQAAMTALAAVVAGKAQPTGRSPVEVPGLPRSACRP
jgi:beta-N-acetylhexosaminidase